MASGAQGYKIMDVIGTTMATRYAMVDLDVLGGVAERASVPVAAVNRFTFCISEIGRYHNRSLLSKDAFPFTGGSRAPRQRGEAKRGKHAPERGRIGAHERARA